MYEKFYKQLSKNDTGETHSHQAGIRIPYSIARESNIFPRLSSDILNPRETVCLIDEDGNTHVCQFIWYNDELWGKCGKRGHNEYRLTCISNYLKEHSASEGDEIWFGVDEKGIRRMGIEKHQTNDISSDVIVIKISKGWTKTIAINNN